MNMENRTETVWLYLEPYTFISEEQGRWLFYNAFDKEGFIVLKDEALIPIVKHLQDVDQLYSVRISLCDLDNPVLFNFVCDLQNHRMGNLLAGKEDRPVIMPPVLNLQYSVDRMKQHQVPVGSRILSYLHHILIYLNGTCNLSCANCQTAFKQYLCCTKSQQELRWDDLKSFIQQIPHTITTILFTGGNCFRYSYLSELLEYIRDNRLSCSFLADWRNLTEDIIKLIDSVKEVVSLKILILEDDYDLDSIRLIAHQLQHHSIAQSWMVSIDSVEQYEKAMELDCVLGNEIQWEIQPVYTGQNQTFFEEFVYTSLQELNSMKLDRRQIFARQVMNMNHFGKLVVDSSGRVYANLHDSPLGSISDSVKQMLSNELETGVSWRRTRYQVRPCQDCCYRLLCPSPSNYELLLGKYNLCYMQLPNV